IRDFHVTGVQTCALPILEPLVLVYLNGEFVPQAEARISVDDRGFLFADGVYEVVRVYDGRPFLMDAHLRRMRQGLHALRIDDAEIGRASCRTTLGRGLRA